MAKENSRFQRLRNLNPFRRSPNERENRSLIKALQATSKDTDNRRLLSPEEIEIFERVMDTSDFGKKQFNAKVETANGKKITTREAYENAQKGDYTAFENLSPLMRHVLASKRMHDFQASSTATASHEDIFAMGLQYDPALRLGLTLDGSEAARGLDAAMTQKVFDDTLAPITPERAAHLESELKEDAAAVIENNAYSQRVMLKLMYAIQAGETAIQKDGVPQSTPRGIYEMFTAGGRTGFILPEGVSTSCVYGENNGRDFGNQRRTAATHSVRQPSIDGSTEYKEIKTRGTKAFSNQHGLNIAAGGLGNRHPSGNTILNNGRSGHLYSHIREGDDKNHGVLLVGIESDAPGMRNFQGHRHTWQAKPESTSCFGTQKSELIGDKYGGRTVDLRGVTDIAQQLESLDAYITQNQQLARSSDSAQREAAQKNLATLTKSLTGPPMAKEDMARVRTLIGNPEKTVIRTEISHERLAASKPAKTAEKQAVKEAPPPQKQTGRSI